MIAQMHVPLCKSKSPNNIHLCYMYPPVETRSEFQFEFKRLYFSNLAIKHINDTNNLENKETMMNAFNGQIKLLSIKSKIQI